MLYECSTVSVKLYVPLCTPTHFPLLLFIFVRMLVFDWISSVTPPTQHEISKNDVSHDSLSIT